MTQGAVKRKPLLGPPKSLGDDRQPLDPNFEGAVRGLEQQSLSSDDDHLSDIQKKLRALLKESNRPNSVWRWSRSGAKARFARRAPVARSAQGPRSRRLHGVE